MAVLSPVLSELTVCSACISGEACYRLRLFFLIVWSPLSSEVGQHLKTQRLSWRAKIHKIHKNTGVICVGKKIIKKLYTESYIRLLLQEAWASARSLFSSWYDYKATKSFGSVNLLYIMINLYTAENPQSSALFVSWDFLPSMKAENNLNKIWSHFGVLCNAPLLACVGQQEEMLSRCENRWGKMMSCKGRDRKSWRLWAPS